MKRLYFRNSCGMTLVELTIATLVLSMVLLAAGTIYVSAVKELRRATDEAGAQAEASAALDHIFLNLMGLKATAVNINPDSHINPDNISIDIDDNGIAKTIKYTLNNGIIEYYPPYEGGIPGASERVAEYIRELTFTQPLMKADATTTINNYVVINITAQKGRMQRTFSTGAVLRGMSP